MALGLVSLLVALVLAGCGGDDENAATASGSGQAELPKVKLGLGAKQFVFGPLVIAEGADLFKKHGVDVEVIETGAATVTFPALLNGDMQFGGIVFSQAMEAAKKGQFVTNVALIMDEYASDVVVSDEFAEKSGIADGMEWRDSITRMKGAKIAVSAVGGGPDQMIRRLFDDVGLDADKDAQIVPIADTAGRLAAVRTGRVDATITSSPVPEQLVSSGEGVFAARPTSGLVDTLEGLTYTTLAVNKQYATEHPDVVQKVVDAMTEALQLIQEDPDRAKEAIASQEAYKKLDPKLIDESWENNLPAFPESPVIPDTAVQDNAETFAIDDPPDASEIVDNSFAEKAEAGG